MPMVFVKWFLFPIFMVIGILGFFIAFSYMMTVILLASPHGFGAAVRLAKDTSGLEDQ